MTTTNWFREDKTIIIHRFEAHWTIQDFRQSLRDANELLNTVDYEVTHFLDMVHSKNLPQGFLSTLYRSSKMRHPNSGRVIVLSANPLILAFIRFYTKIYPHPSSNFFITGSIEEALGIIGQLPLERV